MEPPLEPRPPSIFEEKEGRRGKKKGRRNKSLLNPFLDLPLVTLVCHKDWGIL